MKTCITELVNAYSNWFLCRNLTTLAKRQCSGKLAKRQRSGKENKYDSKDSEDVWNNAEDAFCLDGILYIW